MIEDIDLVEIKEIDDDSIEWVEELVDVYIVNDKEFFFDDLIDDFTVFYEYMFLRLGFGTPTEAQVSMAEYISSDIKQDKMLLALRGLAKSLTTELYVLWRLLRDNDEHILVRSASSKRSRNFTTFLLNLLKTTPVLQHLAPRNNQRKSTEMFDVNGAEPSDSPSVYSAGVGASITGMRASIVISDDIEVPSNSGTEETRNTLLEQYNESINLLVESNGVSGEVIVLGTYQSMDSIYLTLEATDAFKVHMIPAIYPDLNQFYINRIAPYLKERIENNPDIIGTAVDTRFNMIVLNKRKMRIGKSAFELQYMLNPTLSDDLKYPLKLRDLMVYDIDPIDNPIRFVYSSEEKLYKVKHRGFNNDYFTSPSWLSPERSPFDFTILAVDPSGRGTDETGYVVISLMGGKLFIRDFGGLTGGYDDDALDALVAKAIRYQVNAVVGESNFGDGAYIKMLETKLKLSYNCKVDEVRATSQKELRIIDTLEPLMNQHRIVVDRGAIEKDFDKSSQYSLTYQMTHITKERGSLIHDDIIDVIELGSKYLIEYMAVGDTHAMQKSADDRAKEIEDIMKGSLFPNLVQKKQYSNLMDVY